MGRIDFIPVTLNAEDGGTTGLVGITEHISLGREFSPYSIPNPWARAFHFESLLELREEIDNNWQKKISFQSSLNFIRTVLKGLYIGKLRLENGGFSDLITNSFPFKAKLDELNAPRNETNKIEIKKVVYQDIDGKKTVAINYPTTLFFPTKHVTNLDGVFNKEWEKLHEIINKSFLEKCKDMHLHTAEQPFLTIHRSEETELDKTLLTDLFIQDKHKEKGEEEDQQKGDIAKQEILAMGKNQKGEQILITIKLSEVDENSNPLIGIRNLGKEKDRFTKVEFLNLEQKMLQWLSHEKGICFDEFTDKFNIFDTGKLKFELRKFQDTDERESLCCHLSHPEHGDYLVRVEEDEVYNKNNINKLIAKKIIKLNPEWINESNIDRYTTFIYPRFPFNRLFSFCHQIKVSWHEISGNEAYCKICFPGGLDYEKTYNGEDIITYSQFTKGDKTGTIQPEETSNNSIYKTFIEDICLYLWPHFFADAWDFYYLYITLQHDPTLPVNVKIIDGKCNQLKIDIKCNEILRNDVGRHVKISRDDFISFSIDKVETGFYSASHWLQSGGLILDSGIKVDSLSIDLGTVASCAHIYRTDIQGLNPVDDVVVPDVDFLMINGKVQNEKGMIPVAKKDSQGLVPTIIGKRKIENSEIEIGKPDDGGYDLFNLVLLNPDIMSLEQLMKDSHSDIDLEADIKWESNYSNSYNYKRIFIRLYLTLILAKIRSMGFNEIEKIKLSVPLSFSQELKKNYRKYTEDVLEEFKDTGIKLTKSICLISENDVFIQGKGTPGCSIPAIGSFLIMDMGGGSLDISCTTTLRAEPLFIESFRLAGNKILKKLMTSLEMKKYELLVKLQSPMGLDDMKKKLKDNAIQFQHKFLKTIQVFVKKCLDAYEVIPTIEKLYEEMKYDVNSNINTFSLKYYLFGRGWSLFDDEVLKEYFPIPIKIEPTQMKTALVRNLSTLLAPEDTKTQIKTIAGLNLKNDKGELYLKESHKIPFKNDTIKNFSGLIGLAVDKTGFFQQIIPEDILALLEEAGFDKEMLQMMKREGGNESKRFTPAEFCLDFISTMINVNGFADSGINRFCFNNGCMIRSPIAWLILQDAMDFYLNNDIISFRIHLNADKIDFDTGSSMSSKYKYESIEFSTILNQAKIRKCFYEDISRGVRVIDFTKQSDMLYFVFPFRDKNISDFFAFKNRQDSYYNLPENEEMIKVEKIDLVAVVSLRVSSQYKTFTELLREGIDILDYLDQNVEKIYKGRLVYKKRDVEYYEKKEL